ncbi:MAG: hypothetical protein MJ237_03375 [bacterium]|nr:hypothetical protein [bacterium]
MNSGFYKDVSTNYEYACEIMEENFSHAALIEMLQNGNIPQKQIAAFKLKTLKTEHDGKVLISNLTGCDGKIREAVAFKINNLLKEKSCYSEFLNFPEVFANATVDINGNICRLVIDSVNILKMNKEFSDAYLNKVLLTVNEAFDGLDKIIYKDKKYAINKHLFKLYWCLEAIKLFTDYISEEKLLKILLRASQESEYTIREKVAQILIILSSPKFDDLKNTLIHDSNYYVRTVFG